MISFVSILLATLIIIFLLIFKRKSIMNFSSFGKYSVNKKVKVKIKNSNQTNKFISEIKNKRERNIYTPYERSVLRQDMKKLFNGSKEEKIQALRIAENLSDLSTINLLRRGLKDMDPDIVKICAKLIEKFK